MNNCKIDFVAKEIRITKSFYKSSQVFGTAEFNTMIELQSKLPDYKISVQKTAKRPIGIWYPTYTQMMDYIQNNCDGDDGVAELKKIIDYARYSGRGYNLVRTWFMSQYPGANKYANADDAFYDFAS